MDCKKSDISDKLILFVEGSLPEGEAAEVREHIEKCPQCRQEVKNLTAIAAALDVGSRHIKERWNHPTVEDLFDFAIEPEKIPQETKNLIEAHIALCPLCRQEVEEMKESPQVEASSEENKVHIPAEVIETYRKTMNIQKAPGQYEEFMENLNNSLEWLFKRLLYQERKLYPALATIAVIIFLAGLIFYPAIQRLNENPEQQIASLEGKREIKFESGKASASDVKEFANFLRKSGISTRVQDGRIFIDATPDQNNEKSTAKKNVKSSAEMIVNKIIIRKTKRTPLPLNNGPKIKTARTVFRNDYYKGVPITEEIAPENYPKVSPTVRNPPNNKTTKNTAKTPQQKTVTACHSINKTTTTPTTPEKEPSGKTITTSTSENDSVSSAATQKYGSANHQEKDPDKNKEQITNNKMNSAVMANSAKETGEIREDYPSSNLTYRTHSAFENIDPLEREKTTKTIRNQFKNKIEQTLSRYDNLPECRVYVNISLSFIKNDQNEYEIQGTKVRLHYSEYISRREKDEIRHEIKKSLQWQDKWDGDIEFIYIQQHIQ